MCFYTRNMSNCRTIEVSGSPSDQTNNMESLRQRINCFADFHTSRNSQGVRNSVVMVNGYYHSAITNTQICQNNTFFTQHVCFLPVGRRPEYSFLTLTLFLMQPAQAKPVTSNTLTNLVTVK